LRGVLFNLYFDLEDLTDEFLIINDFSAYLCAKQSSIALSFSVCIMQRESCFESAKDFFKLLLFPLKKKSYPLEILGEIFIASSNAPRS